MTDAGLIELLGGGNALVATHAWQELAVRKSPGLAEQLEPLVTDSTKPVVNRRGALWALEGLAGVTPPLLVKLAGAREPEFRHEAVRIAGEISLPEADFLAVFSALGGESHFRVRAAIANAVRQHRQATPKVIACAASLGLGASRRTRAPKFRGPPRGHLGWKRTRRPDHGFPETRLTLRGRRIGWKVRTVPGGGGLFRGSREGQANRPRLLNSLR